MKYLITGGCGFLGSNLAHEVLERGHQLYIFDNLSRTGSIENLEWLQTLGHFEYLHGDIRSAGDVKQVVKDCCPDVVFHLAGQVAMTTSIAYPRKDFEVNSLGTLNVLEAVRQYHPTARVIYSSTNKVYGDLEQYSYKETETRYKCIEKPNGFDENSILEFHSPYGCSKGAADQYMLDYARIFGLNTVVFRHSSMYGGRQFATYDQGWVGWFCLQALLQKRGEFKEPFTISGNGKQVRDVLHAKDMKRLYFAGVEHMDRIKGQAFNVGGGMENSYSLLELFALLENILGVTLQYRELPPRESDQRVFVADISKISQLTGWVPEVSAESGVAQMLGWVKEATGNV